MNRSLAPALVLIAAGCALSPPFVDQMQGQATLQAERRAQFELACPSAMGRVIRREQFEPQTMGERARAQYTVGVSGCGQRMNIEVLCTQNNNQCVERVASS